MMNPQCRTTVRALWLMCALACAAGSVQADERPAVPPAATATTVPHPDASTPPTNPESTPATVTEDRFVEELTTSQVGQVIQRFSYFAIIAVLLLCGMGLPLPEEVPILTSGVLSRLGHMEPWTALAALLIGVMLGDSAMFLLGRRWGSHLFEHRFARRMLTKERQEKIAVYFARYGAFVIFAARYLPGLRAPLFLTAGSMRVSFWTFFSMDGLAALISVPLSFWVAYYFTDRLQEVLELSHRVLYWVLGAVMVLMIAAHFAWDWWKARRARLQSVQPPPE